MTKYQRSLMNKMDALTIELQSDWESRCKLLTRSERLAKEQELRLLQNKLNETYSR